MKKRLLAAFLPFLIPAFLSAQYEQILNDPDVIWAAEITLEFIVEPEYAGITVDSLNSSVPLKILNANPGEIVPDQNTLASRLLDLAENGPWPVYLDPKDATPLSKAERLKRLFTFDTITVTDVETRLLKNVAVHNDLDPTQLQRVRVRQLLYYRAKTAEFEVFTLGFAPIINRTVSYGEVDVFLYSYTPFWFKSPQAKGKKAAYPDLNSRDITWARRLKTMANDVRLDSLRPFKDLRQPLSQELVSRFRDDPAYAAVNSDWSPILPPERNKLIFKADTVITFDPETYEEKVEVVKSEITGQEIGGLRLMEDWFWEEKSKNLVMRLYAFAPMVEIKDSEGNFRYLLPLFWREKQRKR